MNKLQKAQTAYTFDDFVLVPVYSEIHSRKDPDISTIITNYKYNIPIITAPMNTITEQEMLITIYGLGGIGVLHRYMTIQRQIDIAENVIKYFANQKNICPYKNIYIAVGASGDYKERIQALSSKGFKNFCVDVANGHNINTINTVETIKNLISDSCVMSGNVCSYDGAYRLAEAGTDSIRVGVGPGAVCITRQVTGHGIPQLSSVEDCARIKDKFPNVAIIADGGIRFSGDIVKSLAIGADAVMIGSLLAGSSETPGEFIEENNKLYKYYHGMASESARAKWFDKTSAGLVPEGVSKKVPYLGRSAKHIIEGLCSSVKVGLSYSGANNILELRKNAEWRRITGAGYIEGTPHGKNND